MPVQKKCSKKNEYFKNKLLAKRMFFIHGDIGGINSAFCGLRGRDLLTTYLSGIAKWMAKKWTDASIPYLNRKRSQCVFLLERKIIY